MTTFEAGRGVLLQQELRQAGLPPYLMRAVLEVLPDALTDSTVDLLVSNLRGRGESKDPAIVQDQVVEPTQDSGHRGPPSGGDSSRKAQSALDLVDGWVADGGDPASLERVLALVDYRIEALALERAAGDDRVLIDTQNDLDSFWLSSGHDLQELGIFQKHVRTEAFGAMPK